VTVSGSIPPPPGWYPDPAGEKAWRWWDGNRWTEHASDPTGSYGFDSASAARVRFEAELRMVPWAKRTLLAYLVVKAASLSLAWASRTTIRRSFDDLRTLFDTGRVPAHRVATAAPGLTATRYLVAAVGIGVVVLFLIWQHRAATTARSTGLPATHSPAMGVGSWFIPVVDLWFPYQAIRDCLPAQDPARRQVLHMWLLFLATYLAGTATSFLVLWGPWPGAVGSAVDMGLGLLFVLAGIRVVGAIARSHRRLLGLE
jgi:hypothetical protein